MKIAVVHNLPSGGAKRMMYEIIRNLSGRHEFHVFTYETADHNFLDIRPFVKKHTIFPFKKSNLFKSPFGRLNQFIRWIDLNRIKKLDRKIAHKIDEQSFDLAWVNPCQIQNSPSVLSNLVKTPGIFICQEPLRILYEQMPGRPYDKKESKWVKILNKFDPLPKIFFSALKKNDQNNVYSATKVLVNSGFMQDSVSKVYPVKPLVNYAGVDCDAFHPKGQIKENFVFSVGSLTPLKGYDFIIKALSTIQKELRPPFVIACNFANPPEKAYLQNLAESLDVNLEIKTNISDVELIDLYNRAKLTVYAPIREPFGLVAIESMACGTPVVGVAEGGLVETIQHEKTGLLTKRNALDFGTAVQNLLADPEKLERFGLIGRESVLKKWTWRVSAETMDKHFHTLLANSKIS
jgi:glycosyltransferase involved in cell wall biosynthesis